MRKYTCFFIVLVACAPAAAETFFDHTWYFSPQISYIDDDTDRAVDDGLSGFQFGLGKDLTEHDSLEIVAVGTYFNADGLDNDQAQWGLGLDYIRRFPGVDVFEPFVLAGVGYINTHADGRFSSAGDGSGLMASLAGGVLFPPGWFDTRLRIELRMRFDESVDSRRDVMLSIGAHRALGKKPQQRRDEDGDGVADKNDRCGATPRGTRVDIYGCATTRNK